MRIDIGGDTQSPFGKKISLKKYTHPLVGEVAGTVSMDGWYADGMDAEDAFLVGAQRAIEAVNRILVFVDYLRKSDEHEKTRNTTAEGDVVSEEK